MSTDNGSVEFAILWFKTAVEPPLPSTVLVERVIRNQPIVAAQFL